MNLRKIWNNRIFRTFIQTAIGTLSAYFVDSTFEYDSKKLTCLIIMAVSTGLAKIMPLLNEEEKTKEEVTE